MANANRDDLLWAVNSPPLFAMREAEGSGNGFQIPDTVPAPPEFQTGKVGHYFESLLRFWLEEIRGCELIAHREQVIENNITKGELDFVFRDYLGLWNHWQTAVKFYLYSPETPVAESAFVGPNTADTLERKHRRLFEHQLPLSAKRYPKITIRRGFVKGRIYHHPFHPDRESSPILNPDHLLGIWLRQRELDWLDQLENAGACEYRILEKPYWLASAPFKSLDVNNLRTGLTNHFKSSKKSIHVEISRAGASIERLFVVADEWPFR